MEISTQTQTFINAHRHEDIRALALQAKRTDDLDLPFALDQIAGRQTAQHKLPQWAEHDGIIYPPHISMEQCSSQFTAQYKAKLAQRILRDNQDGSKPLPDSSITKPEDDDNDSLNANQISNPAEAEAQSSSMADITGGFGVDFSYMARQFTTAIYIERQPHLCEIAQHNMNILGLNQAVIRNGDAEELLADLEERNQRLSLIFADPARRDSHGSRTYAIADCTPDVLALHRRMLAIAPIVMLKLSPMLDWRKTAEDFQGAVSEIHIVSTGNECKELLLVLRNDHQPDQPVHMVCVNDSSIVAYEWNGLMQSTPANIQAEAATQREPLEQQQYLYEPNASLMKAGAFDIVSERYPAAPVSTNSHLFVSNTPIEDFPGRGFAIEAVSTMNKRELRSLVSDLTHANIATRNFPLSVQQLRAKLRLRDGGSAYLFAATDRDGRHCVIRTHRL